MPDELARLGIRGDGQKITIVPDDVLRHMKKVDLTLYQTRVVQIVHRLSTLPGRHYETPPYQDLIARINEIQAERVAAERAAVRKELARKEAARLVSTPVTSRLKALAAKKAEEQAAMRRRARQVANLPPLAERKRGDWWDH
ncbi:hypothetical protein OG625_38575 [Streptomyces sp. NBC_01351]|uniref:hypothetical protein n=1 Tax=Streptomyces sp. NBC_01351 TaxID=2903833 RepID=UPI002E350603|nr:hypothetical protein [Streptomyces sp. NBC_01351]